VAEGETDTSVPDITPLQRRLILVTTLTGLGTVSFLITVLSIAQVEIGEEFNTASSTVSWIVTAPMLLNAVFGPLFGKLGDIYGHRRAYLVGFAISGVLALMTAGAPTLLALVVLRSLSATAGSATNPSSIALLASIFPPEERVKAMSYWTITVALSPVMGLILGGVIIDTIGWRGLFLAQAVPTLVTLVLAHRVLPETPRRAGASVDVAGAFTLGVGVAAVLIAMVQFGPWGVAHPLVLASMVIGPIMLVAFFWVEQRVESPLFPMEYLRNRNYTVAIGTSAFSSAAYMGVLVSLPFLLDEEFGFEQASGIGLILMIRPLSFSLSGGLSGRLTPRVGERLPAVGGNALIAVSTLVLVAGTQMNSLALVIASLVLAGSGLGVSRPPIMASSVNAVNVEDIGVANGVQGMVSQIGNTLGIAGIATIHESIDGPTGFTTAFYVAFVLAVIGAAIAFWLEPSERRPQPASLLR
jgi:MFS family permease